MVSQKTYRILVWVIAILLATNISTFLSFWYHKTQDARKEEEINQKQIEMPTEQRTRFFRDQLDLTIDQVDLFRNSNRNFNRTARQISYDLEELRMEMVEEMGKEIPDEQKLHQITTKIGELHTELKNITITYYKEMKSVCTPEQAVKLQEIFKSVLNQNEQVKLPQRGGHGRNRE